MTDWAASSRELETLLRLKTFPLGLRFLKTAEELKSIKCRRPETFASLCQLITQSRTAGTTIGCTVTDLTPLCATVVGLRSSVPDSYMLTIGEVWFKNKEDALDKYTEENWPRVPHKFEAVVMSPLAAGRIEPDMVILYGSPAQVTRIVNGLQWEHYEKLNFTCCGESACSDSIGRCYVTGKPSVGIPCFGERRFGHAQDDELMVALPPSSVDTLIAGLKALDKVGIRYPIAYAGAQVDLFPGFPPSYREGMTKDHERLLNNTEPTAQMPEASKKA
jgi:uncharacterized protein (DUF169 family)